MSAARPSPYKAPPPSPSKMPSRSPQMSPTSRGPPLLPPRIPARAQPMGTLRMQTPAHATTCACGHLRM
jgi:hypothetical protein